MGNSIIKIPAQQKEDATVVFLFPYKYDQPNLNMIYGDFFEMFIGSSIQSIIMYELREKLELIYTATNEFCFYPDSGLLNLEISTKKSNVKQVINKTNQILVSISHGEFNTKIFNNLKKQFILSDLQEPNTNDFYTRFYGLQLMNKLTSLNNSTRIYSYLETMEIIDKLTKKEFVKFIKTVLNFNDMKIVYQL